MLLIPSLVSIFAIYRFTINFTGLPYSNSLRQSSSAKFRETSQEIVNSLQTLFSSFPGERNISVLNYRYQKVIGTLVTIEVKLRKAEPKLEEIIKRAIKSGYIGRYAVGFNGFEYQTLRESTRFGCLNSQFQCKDGTCIGINQRCDGFKQCRGGDDEDNCERNETIITLFTPYKNLLPGSFIRISAKVRGDFVSSHKTQWLHNGKPLEQSNGVIRYYNTSMKYYLLIDNITTDNNGTYEISINGAKKGIVIYVGSNSIPNNFHQKECFDGNNCAAVICEYSEYFCQVDNFCLPKSVICNGKRDCSDVADELNCSLPHHYNGRKQKWLAAQPTVKCPDGSTPEFSLHGSTYCWSNAVCPMKTACIEGKCCSISSLNDTPQCQLESWECDSGECIPLESRCDGFPECRDGSDETHCGLILIFFFIKATS